jgi:hypothetical protein
MRDVGRRVRTWSLPAVAYWISGPYNDPDPVGPLAEEDEAGRSGLGPPVGQAKLAPAHSAAYSGGSWTVTS